jgi:hypothetical protein
LRADATKLSALLDELNALIPAGGLELDGELLPADLRDFLLDPVFDSAKLVRVDSHPAADGTSDVHVSLQPSDLFLELLAALRTGNVDDDGVEAECHGPFLS